MNTLNNNIGLRTKTHGMTNTRLYRIWINIKTRCLNKKDNHYNRWGGRGITICEEWLNDFMNFYDWAMVNGYQENLSIDRIDNNGNYEPNNCRWSTIKEQNRNQRTNNLITYNGETLCLIEWAEKIGIKSNTLWNRLNLYKWSIEKTLTTKIK